MIDLPARLSIARSLLGEIDERYNCRCPGEDYHTHKGNRHKINRDCRVYLEESPQNPRGVPSLKCMHSSCLSIVEDVQKKLRSEIGKAERNSDYKPLPQSDEDIARQARARARADTLKGAAEKEKEREAQLLGQYATAAMDLMQEGLPPKGKEQARALLSLFVPSDVVWAGLHAHTISFDDALNPAEAKKLERVRAARPFRTAREWIDWPGLPGPRISPSAFKPGILSRSNQFIAARRFMVIEHDKYSLDAQAALMRWLMEAEGLKLRALIFTGGKSLHGWFDYPGGDLEKLKARLCGVWAGERDAANKPVVTGGLAFDPSTFNPSHSYRVPGWKHEKTGNQVELWRINP